MITELKIENYKSIQDLTLEVGRVNVLIGENGCGKSNILEAITFAAAAEANKLDNEFLKNRGIRVTEPKLMRSAFDDSNLDKKIEIIITSEQVEKKYFLQHDNHVYSNWKDEIYENIYNTRHEEITKIIDKLPSFKDTGNLEGIEKLKNDSENIQSIIKYLNQNKLPKLRNFIIYSPENTILRDFSKEANIDPLGDKGEGLLKLLIYTQNDAKKSQDFSELNDIQETLELFGWYESIVIPEDFSLLEKKITIKDRYLEMPFDQRSANEGFLLVLFYITLVVSKYTPKIFAIDNIDTSLNPKLCTKLIKELARLAKKYDKQLFVTSHNPAILDGIDLGDDEQRLFVISRNDAGHTCCDRVELKDKPKSSVKTRLSKIFEKDEVLKEKELLSKKEILDRLDDSPEPLKLSEAFLRGYLGGLPEGF
jgi:predicted ATPase